MKNLTKAQKLLIVLSILWEIIALVISYQTQRVRGIVVEYLNLKDFILASLPVILLWSVIWIWGFNWLKKITNKKILENIKYLFSFLFVLSKSMLKAAWYFFIFICIVGGISYILKSAPPIVIKTNKNTSEQVYEQTTKPWEMNWEQSKKNNIINEEK